MFPAIGPGHAKTCLTPYANNKGADQPAHQRSLISTFIFRCLGSMICILAISKRSRFQSASVAEQASLNLTQPKIPEDTFSRDVAQLFSWVLAKYRHFKQNLWYSVSWVCVVCQRSFKFVTKILSRTSPCSIFSFATKQLTVFHFHPSDFIEYRW